MSLAIAWKYLSFHFFQVDIRGSRFNKDHAIPIMYIQPGEMENKIILDAAFFLIPHCLSPSDLKQPF